VVIKILLKVGVIGLGYVGLPLALEISKFFPTIGFDTDENRVNELISGFDNTLESDRMELMSNDFIKFTSKPDLLKDCNYYIVTVPTPIFDNNKPNLDSLFAATKLIGGLIKSQDIVIYESTVYPGTTEEICVPILEKCSGLKLNETFFVGYSPERVNPGDKSRRVTNIIKVVSGSHPIVAKKIQDFYNTFIEAGTFLAKNIKTAEAAKIIENTQRDLNIALINELSIIFNKMKIDTHDVLVAASTKWNFHQYQPGLVGGHCIGVDPYYLTFKAQELGYEPKVILSGREINDGMPKYVAERISNSISQMHSKKTKLRVLLLGLTFKENCPDVRNSGPLKLAKFLSEEKLMKLTISDPWLRSKNDFQLLNSEFKEYEELNFFDYEAIIVAQAHSKFHKIEWKQINERGIYTFDLKNIIPRNYVTERL
jgi:UDP-N-acetyl-D-glucosamine/UDP-N-acetyl-D-galactosamine dehydrogenase